MKNLIPSYHYTDDKIFNNEKVILFQNIWNFAGFMTDLTNHNDYLCTDIGGKSVVIQNFHGELRAFHNVCSHRFSRIRQHSQGNAPLVCPYHGWVYNSEGIPVGIPNRAAFENMNDATIGALTLEKWVVENCGAVIFIKRYDDGISLRNYLGSFYEIIRGISENLGERIDYREMIVKANWKIILENSMESYHIKMVHPNNFGRYSISEIKYDYDSFHSAYDLSFSQSLKLKKVPYFQSSTKIKTDGYYNFMIFPRMTLGTIWGISFTINVLQPIRFNKTKIISYVFLRKLNNISSESAKIITDVMKKSITEFNQAAFDEDNAICEQVQLGMSEKDPNKFGVLCREEERIYKFHDSYMKFIKTSNIENE